MPNLFKIASITLKNFGSDSTSGGTPSINDYDGSTLYCHIKQDTDEPTKVAIIINQTPPNEFQGSGKIARVHIDYVIGTTDRHMKWDSALPTGKYNGEKLRPYLSFAPNMKSATLVLDRNEVFPAIVLASNRELATEASETAQTGTPDPNEIPTLGLVILGPELTQTEAKGYFVSVPLARRGDNPEFRQVALARVKWPKDDSISGPVGSVNVP